MAKGDPPVVALKKAVKKLENVQRNLAEAGCTEEAEACIRLKEQIVERHAQLGGAWQLSDKELAMQAESQEAIQASPHAVSARPAPDWLGWPGVWSGRSDAILG